MTIIGAGFAGMEAAKTLAGSGADITLIDRRNYHLFQPMLYQVATGSLAEGDVAVSIRSVFRNHRKVEVLYDEVLGIDLHRRLVFTRDDADTTYDYLIVAPGSEYNYFGHDDWSRAAPGLKSLDDARSIRRDVLAAFEKAEAVRDRALQRKLLRFVLIGAGPTGVEMAGAIAEIAREGLGDFRHIDRALVEVLLVEAGPTVLPGFPEKVRAYAQRELARRGVAVMLNSPVRQIEPFAVGTETGLLRAGTIIWCAGVRAMPAARWLAARAGPGGAVLVEPDLSLPGYPEVFVAGDAAAVRAGHGYLPGLASVAKQQGRYLGKLITANIRGHAERPPFSYRDYGTMATIGRGAAAADFGFVQFTGPGAWLLWGLVHIYYLIGFRNRLAVFANWIWTMLRVRRRHWLITGLPIADYVSRTEELRETGGDHASLVQEGSGAAQPPLRRR